MNDDSNQSQRGMYNRLQQETQYATPAYEPIFTHKLPGRFNGRSILLLSFIIVFILACTGGVTSLVFYIEMQNQPTQCSGNSVGTPICAKELVQEYYFALKNKNYAKAISYFDPEGTIVVPGVHHQVLLSQLPDLDTDAGQMQEYQVNDPISVSNKANEVTITVTVTRQVIRHARKYMVHLILKQEKEGWKIISASI